MSIDIHVDKIYIHIKHLKLDMNMDIDISIMNNYKFIFRWIIFIYSWIFIIPNNYILLLCKYCYSNFIIV